MTRSTVLLVDDEEETRRATSQTLDLAGFSVRDVAAAERALDLVNPGFSGVVVTDIRMPGMDGMTLLQRVREIDPDIPVLLITGHGDVQLAVKAMREGAYDFIEKPYDAQDFSDRVGRALNHRKLVVENRVLRAAAGKNDDIEARIPGRTQAMIDLRYRLRAVGRTDADILIIGDTGTGKEVLARAVHDLSGRASKPFVAIDCAALPETLIESELFGHDAGAFPGAMRARFGKFEHARGGTILLDEIGSMPPDLQVKLLRVIQERVITRLGSNEAIPIDARFIATSKVDLEGEVKAGRFRADLLYRLNVITLHVPSLVQRREDIPLLFQQLVREAAVRYRRDDLVVPPDTLVTLSRGEWPGNIRELRNAADRYVLGLPLSGTVGAATPMPGQLADQVAAFEKGVIAGAITAHAGSLKAVYESLGISRKTLYDKMQRYGLDKSRAE